MCCKHWLIRAGLLHPVVQFMLQHIAQFVVIPVTPLGLHLYLSTSCNPFALHPAAKFLVHVVVPVCGNSSYPACAASCSKISGTSCNPACAASCSQISGTSRNPACAEFCSQISGASCNPACGALCIPICAAFCVPLCAATCSPVCSTSCNPIHTAYCTPYVLHSVICLVLHPAPQFLPFPPITAPFIHLWVLLERIHLNQWNWLSTLQKPVRFDWHISNGV